MDKNTTRQKSNHLYTLSPIGEKYWYFVWHINSFKNDLIQCAIEYHTYTLSHVGEKSGILLGKKSQQSQKRIKNKNFGGTYQSSDKDCLVLRPIFHQFIECKWHRSYISIYCNFRFCHKYLFVQQNIPLILVTTSAGMTKNLIITTTIRPRKECRITIIGSY